MNSTEAVLKFLVFLAKAEAMFRKVNIFAEHSPAIRTASTMVIPCKSEPSDYADGGAIISVALNAELHKPSSRDQKALGMSLLLRHTGGMWLAEAEVGWSGERIGWDPFDSKEAQAKSIEEIISLALPLVEWMDTRFREAVDNLPK